MDEDKFFILNRGVIEDRIDPYYYKPEFSSLRKQLELKGFIRVGAITKSWSRGDGPRDGFYTDDFENGVPFIRVNNLKDNTISLKDVKYIHRHIHEKRLRRAQVAPGDIVFAISGTKDNLGTLSIVPEDLQEANLNSALVKFKIDERYNKQFFCNLFDMPFIRTQIDFIGKGAAQNNLNNKEISSIQIPNLDYQQQTKISDLFEAAREARKKKENQAQELLASIDDYLLNELGINLPPEPDNTIENRKFRTEWANVTGNRFDPDYYSDHYQNKIESIENGIYATQPLSQVTDLVLNGKTPSSDSYCNTETNYPIIKVGSYTGNYIDLDKVSYSKTPLLRFVKQGDIFILSAAHQAQYVGRHIKLLEKTPEIPTSYVGELICVRPDNQLIQPYFLFALLSTEVYKTLINREKTGQTSHVYPSDIRKIKLPIPDIDHQRQMEVEIIRRYNEARDLTASAIQDFRQAKQEIEQLILNNE